LDLTFELEPDAAAPARARRRLVALEAQVEPSLLDDLLIVVSELVANSVKYGPGEPITVRLRVDGARLVQGEVEDEGEPREPPQVRLRPGGPSGGYGLNLVDRLSTRWGVREGSTRVWFVLDRRFG
jgi:anti-sigma regulatory factor (Ser/Thr protein kinase)